MEEAPDATSEAAEAVHVARPLRHPRSITVLVCGALSIAGLGGALTVFGGTFMVVALLAGMAGVSVGRHVLSEIDASPALFSGRGFVLAATCVAGVAAGLAACSLASTVAAVF